MVLTLFYLVFSFFPFLKEKKSTDLGDLMDCSNLGERLMSLTKGDLMDCSNLGERLMPLTKGDLMKLFYSRRTVNVPD